MKRRVPLNRKLGILDKSAFGAARPWADRKGVDQTGDGRPAGCFQFSASDWSRTATRKNRLLPPTKYRRTQDPDNYEAGVCGYNIHHQLTTMGIDFV